MYLVGDHVGFSDKIQLDEKLNGKTILANLEGPWSEGIDCPRPPKAGPRLHNSHIIDGPEWIFTLANNHMMDFGWRGVEETEARLREKNIPFVGVGKNIQDSYKPLIFEEDGKRIGVLACAEYQFGMANMDSPGVAPMGMWLFEAIHQLKQKVDIVIVSCHVAVEMSPIPSPILSNFYHALIDAGADIIHGHHAHVPQGWEQYKHGYVFYGLGNFIVNPAKWAGSKNTCWSLAANIIFDKDEIHVDVVRMSIHEKSIDSVSVTMDPLNNGKYYSELNSIFADVRLYIGAWQEIAVRLYHSLYEHNLGFYSVDKIHLSCRNWIKRIYHAFGTLFSFIHTKKKSIYPFVQYNFFQCFSHQDLISEAMGVLLGFREDFRNNNSAQLVEYLLEEAK